MQSYGIGLNKQQGFTFHINLLNFWEEGKRFEERAANNANALGRQKVQLVPRSAFYRR
ncbi:MAG: hypothetical protein GY797_05090 [Deltaproteobacteria bacterium]|nr:hypothetical protein [Deltaproteobacteria bacterium]